MINRTQYARARRTVQHPPDCGHRHLPTESPHCLPAHKLTDKPVYDHGSRLHGGNEQYTPKARNLHTMLTRKAPYFLTHGQQAHQIGEENRRLGAEYISCDMFAKVEVAHVHMAHTLPHGSLLVHPHPQPHAVNCCIRHPLRLFALRHAWARRCGWGICRTIWLRATFLWAAGTGPFRGVPG